MTKHEEFLRQARSSLTRVARPLACSVAIHLGLGAIVVAAGSAGLAAPHSARVVWLDLEPAEIPPPAAPAPPAVASRPAPVVTQRKPAPTPAVEEPPVAPAQPAAPTREVTAPEPPPAPSAASVPEAPSVAASFKTPEPDPNTATSGTAAASGTPRGPLERGPEGLARSAVASRTPDAAPGGPIVRAARPKGGYQVRPVYPESARRAGIQGTTLLRIHIETDGRVSDISVERSAGHQSLDQAAADAVRRWRFEPALSSSGPVAMSALVPVEFRIGDRE
jgi:periplasmic protein TonB